MYCFCFFFFYCFASFFFQSPCCVPPRLSTPCCPGTARPAQPLRLLAGTGRADGPAESRRPAAVRILPQGHRCDGGRVLPRETLMCQLRQRNPSGRKMFLRHRLSKEQTVCHSASICLPSNFRSIWIDVSMSVSMFFYSVLYCAYCHVAVSPLLRDSCYHSSPGVVVSAKNSAPLSATVSKASASAMEVMEVSHHAQTPFTDAQRSTTLQVNNLLSMRTRFFGCNSYVRLQITAFA